MLTIKSITSCNLNTTPLYSNNISQTISEYKKQFKDIYNENYIVVEDDLVINSIQGVYGYRCGLLGYLSNLVAYKFSEKSNPEFLQMFLNRFVNKTINSNDYEIISFGVYRSSTILLKIIN